MTSSLSSVDRVWLVLTLLTCLTVSVSWGWHHPSSDFYPSRRLYYKNPRNAPSEFCPRDEAQAQLQGRTCLRKCTSDEDCKSKKKKCLCDGACGMSCIKPERECPDPEPPRNVGDVRITGKTFGSKALYTCPKEYRLIGIESRVCQADGTWSNSAPACEKSVACSGPPKIPNAKNNAPIDQKTFDLDTSLQYQCNPGYSTQGFARSKCFFFNGTAKWFGPDFTCEPISCGMPPDILNGRTEYFCSHYLCKANYICQAGFEVVGKAQHICHQNGSWIPEELPSCQPVQCDPPQNPVNGKAIYSSTSFNSIVTYECKYGYQIVGLQGSTRRCGPGKKWEPLQQPECREINCGSPGTLYNGWLEGTKTTLHAAINFHCLQGMTFEGSTDRIVCQSDSTWSGPMAKCHEVQCEHPGLLHNGWIENIERGTALGNSIIFRCFDGMTLVGHGSAICNIDGKWTNPLPLCLAPCTVPEVPFGNVTTLVIHPKPKPTSETSDEKFIDTSPPTTIPPPVILPKGTLVPHGKPIGLECEKQYEPTYNITPSTCSNGTWTHPPRCQPARCKSLPRAPRHGMVIAPKTEHGMKARYSCKDGWLLIGPNLTECQYGNWRGDTPTCQITYCKYLPPPEHGRVLLVGNMGLYDYRNYVTKVANNRQIMFECDRGYVLADGPQGKTCIRGEWAPKTDPPRCIPSQHPSFRWIRSVRRKRRAIKSGSSIGIRNKPGGGGGGGGGAGPRRTFKRKGNKGEEEEYEMAPPFCDPLQSEYIQTEEISPGEDENATSFSNLAVLKVSCIHGFGVNLPNETVKCLNGKWKPRAPQCNALPCRTPYFVHSTLYEGSKAMVFLESVRHTKTLDVKCSKGYVLKGKSQLHCWYGEWDVDEVPECVPASCILPAIDLGQYLGGFRPGLMVTHGTEVDYACNGDYKKMVPGPSRCHLGVFKPNKPMCLHPSVALNYTGSMDHGDHHFDPSKDKRKLSSSSAPLPRPGGVFTFTKRACGKPPNEKNALAYLEGKPLDSQLDSFPDGEEVLFRCGNVKPKAKNRWKVTCEDGTWVPTSGPLVCEGELPPDSVSSLMNMINGSCTYEKDEEEVATFYNDQQLNKDSISFPTTSILVSRCNDIGKYQLSGNVRRKCVSGLWIGRSPKCIGNSQLHDYALDKPPTILFRYLNGSIIQSNDGKLVVYSGTTLHMECLWIRKFGTPRWEISNSQKEREEKLEEANKDNPNAVDVLKRVYAEGWAPEEEGRNSALEYRLTIADAQEDDSGSYTCVTPARHKNRIEIQIKTVDCKPLPDHPDLIYSTTATQLGTKVTFKCRSGNALVGAHELVCLASGNWSAMLPKCENVECPDISLLPAMAPLAYTAVTKNGTLKKNETAPPKITIISRDVGGKALFTCSQGYTIQGAQEALCQSNGEWSSAIPLCREVECPEPHAPENGFVSGNPPYKAGDLAQFDCHQGYMMEGQPIVACQDSGKWSRSSAVKCHVACTYPGTTVGGTISQVKFYYGIQETITFDCTDGYELQGARLLHCMKNGKWSNTIPVCKPKNGGGDKSSNDDPLTSGKSGRRSQNN